MQKKLKKTAISLSAAGVGALAAYFLAIRPWHLRWGATDEELRMKLPGDEVKPDAEVQITHGITINAPASEIWKWLVQIGQGRGGFYSYDWLENLFDLEIHNVDEIKPELQNLKVGDFVRSAHKGWLGGKFDETAGWNVVRFEPNHALVLRDKIEGGSWSFVLKPVYERRTRLLARIRADEATCLGRAIFNLSVVEPAHFIMERKMLLTLKERAEESVGGTLDRNEILEIRP